MTYAAFTHAGLTTRYQTGLTTRYQTESLQKSIFLLPNSCNILFVKRLKSLLHSAGKKFELYNLEIHFHQHRVSFLVVKTVKGKRGIRPNLHLAYTHRRKVE